MRRATTSSVVFGSKRSFIGSAAATFAAVARDTAIVSAAIQLPARLLRSDMAASVDPGFAPRAICPVGFDGGH
jgi:hypothetical protein